MDALRRDLDRVTIHPLIEDQTRLSLQRKLESLLDHGQDRLSIIPKPLGESGTTFKTELLALLTDPLYQDPLNHHRENRLLKTQIDKVLQRLQAKSEA